MGINIGQNIPGAPASCHVFGSVTATGMDCIFCMSSLRGSEGRNNSAITEDASDAVGVGRRDKLLFGVGR